METWSPGSVSVESKSMQEQQFEETDSTPSVINPNDPPWNSGIAFLVWIGSVLLIFLVPGLILTPYLLYSGAQSMNRHEMADFAVKDPTAVLIQIAAIIPVHLITFAMCWIVVTKNRKFPFLKTLGWRSGGVRWWHYIAILVAFFTFAGVVGHYLPEQENDLLRILKSSRAAVYLVTFLAVFTAPFIEEVVYRGVLFSAFQRTAGTPTAILLVTLLFALVHFPQYYPSFSTMILLTVLSLILTLVRAKTNNLLPCVILHLIFNLLQSIALILNPELYPQTSLPLDQTACLMFFPK